MHFITAIGQRWSKRWKRAVGVSLTIALLSAVTIVGFASFSAEVFAAWKTPGNAEQALSSGGAFEGLLNFEAPAETVARFEAEKKEDEEVMAEVRNDPLLAKNWKFTQNPTVDAYLLSWYLSSQTDQFKDFVTFVKLANSFLPSSFSAALNSLGQVGVQTAIGFQTFDPNHHHHHHHHHHHASPHR